MPKILIDISDEQHKVLMNQIYRVANEEDFCLASTEIYNIAYLFLDAIEKGTVLSNLTNMDMLKKLFDAETVFQWDLENTSGTLVHIGDSDVILNRAWCRDEWSKQS